jgi:hypothetical protein
MVWDAVERVPTGEGRKEYQPRMKLLSAQTQNS